MDAAQIANDVASATFFFLGSLAVIVGALLALNRFVLGRPLTESWVASAKCSVRRIHHDGSTWYTHQAEIAIKNTSQSRQTVTLVGVSLLFPNDENWNLAEAWDEATLNQSIRAIAPNDTLTFGTYRESPFIHHAVRVHYRFLLGRRRLLWIGRGEPTRKSGSAQVAVNLDDIKFYSSEQRASSAEEEA